MESLKIVLLCVAAACVYGIAHDQITAHLGADRHWWSTHDLSAGWPTAHQPWFICSYDHHMEKHEIGWESAALGVPGWRPDRPILWLHLFYDVCDAVGRTWGYGVDTASGAPEFVTRVALTRLDPESWQELSVLVLRPEDASVQPAPMAVVRHASVSKEICREIAPMPQTGGLAKLVTESGMVDIQNHWIPDTESNARAVSDLLETSRAAISEGVAGETCVGTIRWGIRRIEDTVESSIESGEQSLAHRAETIWQSALSLRAAGSKGFPPAFDSSYGVFLYRSDSHIMAEMLVERSATSDRAK